MSQELSELLSIINSPALRGLLDERKKFMQGKVNQFVREQKLMEAYGALSKLDDIDKFRDVLSKRIRTIQKGGNNG